MKIQVTKDGTRPVPDENDYELIAYHVERAKEGNGESQKFLYTLTLPYVTSVATKHARTLAGAVDRDDLIQEIYIKFFKELGQLSDPERIFGWTKILARNLCISMHRKYANKLEAGVYGNAYVQADEDPELPPVRGTPMFSDPRMSEPEIYMEERERERLLHEICGALSSNQKNCILLWASGFTYREIAGRYSMPLSTVRTHISRAKKNITATVRKMEKESGVKLFGMAPVPFFLWLVNGGGETGGKDAAVAATVQGSGVSGYATSALPAAGAVQALPVAGRTAIAVASAILVGGCAVFGATVAPQGFDAAAVLADAQDGGGYGYAADEDGETAGAAETLDEEIRAEDMAPENQSGLPGENVPADGNETPVAENTEPAETSEVPEASTASTGPVPEDEAGTASETGDTGDDTGQGQETSGENDDTESSGLWNDNGVLKASGTYQGISYRYDLENGTIYLSGNGEVDKALFNDLLTANFNLVIGEGITGLDLSGSDEIGLPSLYNYQVFKPFTLADGDEEVSISDPPVTGWTLSLPSTYEFGGIFAGCTMEYVSMYDFAGDGSMAFSGCMSMKKFSITADTLSIPEYAFDACTSLEEFDAGGGSYVITSVGDSSFSSCPSLSELYVRLDDSGIGEDSFSGCENLVLYGSIDITEVPEGAFSGCSSMDFTPKYDENGNCISSIDFESLPFTSIGDYAFENTGLKEIRGNESPSTLTSIGEYAFYGSDVQKVIWPASVSTISKGCLAFCTDLTDLTIPEGVTEIKFLAFGLCMSLNSVELPDGLLAIGNSAFTCTGISSVRIPSSVVYIGAGAFPDGCDVDISATSLVQNEDGTYSVPGVDVSMYQSNETINICY